jgi:hypothetical protein
MLAGVIHALHAMPSCHRMANGSCVYKVAIKWLLASGNQVATSSLSASQLWFAPSRACVGGVAQPTSGLTDFAW